MAKKSLLIVMLITVFALSGCSEDEAAEGLNNANQNAASGINDASTSGLTGMAGPGYTGITGNNAWLGPEFSDPNNPLSRSTIYFIYDSSDVQPDFIPVINAHARYLAAHPNQKLTLEGHADERGSPEYNIALGDQRAKAVAAMMKAQGASDGQMNLVSYGEEKPAVMGNDESSYERNRRVELSYQR
ncbi:MAG: peptidoglycan-associated lipoprotein Pal [Gammaproteobacteria bacterium]|nr:peptidoglycan-associated lipoprotein Pal [Gammaproteobacteria bacterium]